MHKDASKINNMSKYTYPTAKLSKMTIRLQTRPSLSKAHYIEIKHGSQFDIRVTQEVRLTKLYA